MNKIEIRAVIKHLCKKGLSPQDIHNHMGEVLGEFASCLIVKNWFRDFKHGREHAPGATPDTLEPL